MRYEGRVLLPAGAGRGWSALRVEYSRVYVAGKEPKHGDLCAPLSRIGRTQDSDPARRPAAVSERSGIADLVAPTAAASRWRDRVPFVPFAAPVCSLFPRRVTCAF